MTRLCMGCIHKEFCLIYEYAKQYNEDKKIKFPPFFHIEKCELYKKKRLNKNE